MRKVLFVLSAILVFLGLSTATTFADAVAPVAQASNHAVVLTPMAWTVITGLILPFVIALITKVSSSPAFKGFMGILVAAIAAIIERAVLADGSAVISTGLLLDVGLVYIPQLLTYLGLWQHVDLNGKMAPTKGLG